MKKLITLFLIVTMIASLGLVGCQNNTPAETPAEQPAETPAEQPAQPEPEPQPEPSNNPAVGLDGSADTLRVGMTEAKGIFSPVYYSSSYDGYVVGLVYSNLISKDKAGIYQPNLAESWEITDDVTYTFHMRKDAKFSDGTPVTAHDVEFTYLIMADPTYDGRYVDIVQDLKGFEEYSAEGSTVEKLEGINVIDDYTISFTFEKAQRTNISNLTMPVMPKAYYDYSKGNLEDIKAKAEAPIGSGPYKLDTFVPKQFVSITKNDLYYGTGYAIKNVLMKFVENATEMEEILTGNVDILAGQIEPANLLQAQESGFINLIQYPRSGFGYLKFNCVSPITGDKNVRKALAFAYDGDLFTETFFEGLAVTQDVPMSQVSWAYTDKLQNDLIHYGYEPEKAKQLLEDAGWKVGADGIREKDGMQLVLRVPAMPDHSILDVLVPMLIEQWGAVGAKVEVSYMDFNSLLDLVIYGDNTDKWEVFFLATSISSNDPDSLYTSWHSEHAVAGGNNTGRYSNPELDKLLDQGRTIFDTAEAIPVYEEAARILNDDMPIIVVYANTYTDMVNERIKGMDTDSLFDWTGALEFMTIEQ